MCPRDLCAAGAAPASAAQRKRWSASDWGAPRPSAQRDSRAGALSARDPGRQKNERAHWAHSVGSAYLPRLARSSLSRPREGRACNPHEVRAQASEQPHTSPNGQRGWMTGRSGAAHLAWAERSAERETSRRAWRSAPAVRRRERRALPFPLGEVCYIASRVRTKSDLPAGSTCS